MCERDESKGDRCFVAYSRGHPCMTVNEPPCEFLLGVVQLTNMDTLKQLSNFIVADDVNAIKLLYQECMINLIMSTLPALSSLALEVDEVAKAFRAQITGSIVA